MYGIIKRNVKQRGYAGREPVYPRCFYFEFTRSKVSLLNKTFIYPAVCCHFSSLLITFISVFGNSRVKCSKSRSYDCSGVR